MAKQHFFFKLIPPRPNLPQTITEPERALMAEHGSYCQKAFEAGKLLLFGPVFAPDGAFGVGILEVAELAEARQFGENDPSVRAGMNRFEIYPMQVSASQAKS